MLWFKEKTRLLTNANVVEFIYILVLELRTYCWNKDNIMQESSSFLSKSDF